MLCSSDDDDDDDVTISVIISITPSSYQCNQSIPEQPKYNILIKIIQLINWSKEFHPMAFLDGIIQIIEFKSICFYLPPSPATFYVWNVL